MTATPPGGCPVTDTFKVTTVKVNSVSEIDFPDMCAGGDYPVTVGYVSSCNLIFQSHETILALNDTVFLPDGEECDPYGCSYRSPLHFGGYDDTARVNSVNDIRYVRINMEHSFAGDIYINLTCPNGQKADILKWGDYQMYSNTFCASQISNTSKGWQSDVEGSYNASQGTDFGVPYKPSDSGLPCDATRPNNAPGTGWNYCWSNNTSEGYTYAGGTGSLIYRECNAVPNYDATPTYYWGIPVYPNSFDSSNVAAGTQFYHPDESFQSLVGCPLNGDWYIEVLDGASVDNGYLFGWELALAEDIQEVVYADVVHTTIEGPWVIATSDSSFIFSPPANLPHDTIINYTFHGFDTVVSVSFYARSFTDTTVSACNSFVWNGVTYTSDTIIRDTLANIHGCDSIVTLTLTVVTTPTVSISGAQFFCPDSSATLTAVCNDNPQSYLWNTGETTSSITVTETGAYSVTAYFAGGCFAESSVFHVFESENPILDAHLSDMVAGDTQTVVIGIMAGDNLQYTLTHTEVTFLPDGVPCNGNCSYLANMTFSGFDTNAIIESAEDIKYVRLNMEHSSISDLYINLTCPNGQSSDILKKSTYGSSTSECLSSISASHRGWNPNVQDVVNAYQAHYPYRTIFLGRANTVGSSNNLCDSSLNKPGIGWNYCWSNNTTEGYQYAPGVNSLIYEKINATSISPSNNRIIDSSDYSNGLHFYHPEMSFDSLIGCPVNGTWYIEVIDGLMHDNGYIFISELSVAEHLSPTHYAHVSQNDFADLWVTRTGDSTFIITPPDSLANDTLVGYTFTLVDDNGCIFDTTVYITIYAHKHTELYDTIYASDLPYEWDGVTFTHAGCHDTLLYTAHGADSVVTLYLSVIYTYDTNVCENQFPYVWRNHTFDSADSVTITYPLDCADSIEILVMAVNPVFLFTADSAVCENKLPCIWRGKSLYSSDIYYDSLTTTAGCDSVYKLIFTVNEVFRDTMDYSVCENKLPYIWRGKSLYTSNTYYDSLTTTAGCDSIYVLNFTVKEVFRDTMDYSICTSDLPYLWHNKPLSASGTYYDSLISSIQCDSIYVLHLTVNEVFRDTSEVTVCNNALPYSWHNHDFSLAGTYYDSLTSSFNCDSIYVLTLTIQDTTFSILYDTVLQNNLPYSLNGTACPSAGVYIQHTENSAGCDSTITLYLTVLENVRTELDTTVCDTLLPIEWEGITFATAGVDSLVLQASNGVDSTVVMTVTIINSTSQTTVVSIVENQLPYLINGISYDSAGTYVQHLSNAAGCDSVLTIHLIVANNQITYKQATICDNMLPALWQGHVWFGPGVIIDTFAAVSGADSIVVNTLSVGLSSSSDIYDTVLENNLPYQLNDVNYYTTNDYIQHRTNHAGCDSAITLHLTVLLNQRTELDSTVCDSLLPVVWNGTTFTDSGVDSVLLEASNGVDSTVVMTLHVNASSDSMLTVSAIENNLPYTLNGFDYDSTGTYTQNLDNALGCDSTLTLALTVLYNMRIEVDSAVCDSLLPITWNGVQFTGAGTDSVLLTASTQVDSLVVMTLTVNYPTTGLVTDTIVQNNLPYLLNGTEYDTTGIYFQHLTNVSGCDSTLTLELTVLYNVKTFVDSTVCDSLLPVHWNEITFNEAGTDTVVYLAANGADSIVVMTLNVNPSSYNTLIISEIENNLPYTLNGFDYYSSGTYTQNLNNALGCDSTLIIELTVLYNVRTEVDSAVCDSLLPITWNGVEFTGAATDSVTILAASGVDSTVVMTVTVAYPTTGTFADTVVENSLPYMLNGMPCDTAGSYTQHLTNVNGCDSTLTFELTVLYNVTSEADSAVCPNVLPMVWNGVTFTTAGTQPALLTAANGVDSTVTMTVSLLPTPTAHISGPFVLCADSYTTLTADSAVSYLWSNGMTTQSIDVYTSGTYGVTVTNEFGCIAADTFVVGNIVTVDPIASINLPDMCAGNSYTLTVGYQTTDNFIIGTIEETHSMADTVFLPDGIYCSPYGCSYQSPLTFTDFAAGSTVTNVNDIRYVRLNMEHSYAGDIYINITCPNGQKADIMKYAGTGHSSCTSSIPAASIGWQGGSNASQFTYFGMAYDHSTTSCNASLSSNAPGVGWNYCWSNNTDQGYNYAPGTGSLIYRSVNAHYHPYAYGTGTKSIFDSSNVAAGTQFYHPDQSFASLIGCPLNGNWYIEVVDGYSQDNGYLFGWELALASTFATTNNTEVVSVTVDGPWVTMTDTTTFVISPPDTLLHDTLVTYTVHFYDENGCGYDTIVSLNIYPSTHTVIDTIVCGSFVWNETTYTQSQELSWNGVNAHGCDSTVVIHLTVYPNPITSITGLPVPCVDDTANLVATCVDTAAVLVWSTGDTAQTITVATTGEYSVTASNAGGCTTETTVSVAFSSTSQSTTDTTVCDSFLWNGTTYTQTGVYLDTLTNAAGCDSIITLNLTVNYSYLSHDTLHLLQNQLPYYFAPSDTTFPYGSPAEFQFSYVVPAQNGCDSVIMEKVHVYMNYSLSFDTTVCASAIPLQWHGHTFTTSTTVTDSLQTVLGSDSILTYHVTVDLLNATLGNVTHINCYGESTGAATAIVTGGIAPMAYQWTNGSGTVVSTTTQLGNCPAGNYTFTVSDGAACSSTVSASLNTLHGEMLPGTITGPTTLCFGDTLGMIGGTSATGDDCVYQWQISTDGTQWTPLTGTNNTQNYTSPIYVTNSFQLRRAWISNDCGTLYSNVLNINVWPVSSDTIYDGVCVGHPYQQHGFDISETETIGLGVLTSVKYYTNIHGCDSVVTLILDIYNPQEMTFNVEICEGNDYIGNGFTIPASETIGVDSLLRILNLQTIDGCDSIVRLQATIIDTALHIENLITDFCEELMAELVAVTNLTDYKWSTGEEMPNITVTSPGVYRVTASQGGCSATARYTIEPCVFELYLPNAITPSRGDGLNDYFCISEYAQSMINLFEISIFNRWGEQVFYSKDKTFKWNGEVKGTIYHQNVYNYVIDYTDSAGRPFHVVGSITVL